MFGDKRLALLCCLFHARRHADGNGVRVFTWQCTDVGTAGQRPVDSLGGKACHISGDHSCEQHQAFGDRLVGVIL